ncbi:MAG: type IV-A pilus assembly ATPase PilB [Deltaproteobacteria bacterium RBG_16_54_18]|nr:MAG: type IV-A pilus assembly ATPase PilB [Deltaproteobacteria bacterium RBG_16_54_18]
MSLRLGQLLLKAEIITEEQLKKAQGEQKMRGSNLSSVLIDMGFLSEHDLLEFLHKRYGFPSINLAEVELDPKLVGLVGGDFMHKNQVVPVRRSGSTLYLALVDPFNVSVIDDIKFRTGYHVEVMVASESNIKTTIDRHLNPTSSIDGALADFEDEGMEVVQHDETFDLGELEKTAEEAPVVKLVNLILADAIAKGASDIHVEPYEKFMRVRERIDGVLYEVMRPPIQMKNAIISRIKIMSQLDIAERRLPQGGRFLIRMQNREMDFRISLIPTLFGEKVVMRLLDKAKLQLDLTKLGFEPDTLEVFRESIYRPYGMILVTGPTGSGKTTTLYSVLSELNKVSENICTCEDPIEYNLPGVNQVQMHEAIGLNFAASLREFLRQDPDIILVGEIRDLETAEIGVKAALTGHLVLSTLHTNDAPSTIGRLLDMGVEPFLVSSSLIVTVAQRLIRCICPDCKEPVDIPSDALLDLGVPEAEINDFTCYKGKGCGKCSNIGYRGRLSLYEVMPTTEELQELILRRAAANEIKRAATQAGMKTLRMSGIAKIKQGITTIEEVLRVTVA